MTLETRIELYEMIDQIEAGYFTPTELHYPITTIMQGDGIQVDSDRVFIRTEVHSTVSGYVTHYDSDGLHPDEVRRYESFWEQRTMKDFMDGLNV